MKGLMKVSYDVLRCGLPELYEAFEGWKSVFGRAYSLKGIKGKFFVFLLFLKLCFSFTVAYFLA